MKTKFIMKASELTGMGMTLSIESWCTGKKNVVTTLCPSPGRYTTDAVMLVAYNKVFAKMVSMLARKEEQATSNIELVNRTGIEGINTNLLAI